MATQRHGVARPRLRRRRRAARRPQRHLPAQHGEPAASGARPLSPVRRRRHAPRRRVRQRLGDVPQPLHPHGRLRGRAGRRRPAVGRPGRAAEPVAARRVGRPHADEGRLVDRRRRARRSSPRRASTSAATCTPTTRRRSSSTAPCAGTDGSLPKGVSAHPKVDPATGELLFFNYSTTEPYLHFGVVDAANDVVHYTPIELPGPRLPHDMAFTENFAILNDCPLFWDPDLLAARRPRRALPPRPADPPRRASAPRQRATTSAGSRPLPRTSCTGSTPSRTATRSSSTASSSATRKRRSDPGRRHDARTGRRRTADVPVPRRHSARSGAVPLAPRSPHRRGEGGGPLRLR